MTTSELLLNRILATIPLTLELKTYQKCLELLAEREKAPLAAERGTQAQIDVEGISDRLWRASRAEYWGRANFNAAVQLEIENVLAAAQSLALRQEEKP